MSKKLLDSEFSRTGFISPQSCSIFKRVQLGNTSFNKLFTRPSKLALIVFQALKRDISAGQLYKDPKLFIFNTVSVKNRANNHIDHENESTIMVSFCLKLISDREWLTTVRIEVDFKVDQLENKAQVLQKNSRRLAMFTDAFMRVQEQCFSALKPVLFRFGFDISAFFLYAKPTNLKNN